MTKTADFKPKVILGVAAHPDDLDFGASGSMAKWAIEGADVYYLILTDGSKGSDDEKITPEELIKIRKNEQLNAAKVIGAKNVIFLDYPDAYLEVSMDLKKDITKIIRKIKPDTVITMNPTFLYNAELGFINHSDHRAAGQATVDAVFPMARDRLTFPELINEGYTPHKVSTLLLINFGDGNFFVDITPSIEIKMDALAAHESQISNVEATQGQLRQMAEVVGSKMGVSYGEGFIKIDIPG